MHTLLLYEGQIQSTQRTASVLGSIVGNVTIREIGNAPDSLEKYDALCLVFNFYGALTAGKTKAYLQSHKEELQGKRIACAGVGLSDVGFARYVVQLEDIVGASDSMICMFIRGEEQLPEVAYQIAKRLRAPLLPMPEGQLMAAIDRFIKGHEILTMATASEGYVRCTPLVYLYVDEHFYILTSGGYKFRSLLTNDHIAAEIHDAYDEENENLPRLQIYGKATLIAQGAEEYARIIALADPAPQEEELFLLRITPLKYEFMNPAFRDGGYDARQVVNTAFRMKSWEDSALMVGENSMRQEELRDRIAAQASMVQKEQEALYEGQRLQVAGADEDRGAILSPLERMIAEAEAPDEELYPAFPEEEDENWFESLPEENNQNFLADYAPTAVTDDEDTAPEEVSRKFEETLFAGDFDDTEDVLDEEDDDEADEFHFLHHAGEDFFDDDEFFAEDEDTDA